jgi:hypothetical protein
MKKVMLFDMNNLAMRSVHIKDVKHVDKETKLVTDIDWAYWKLVMFHSIYGALHKVPLHTLVLAVDSKNSWRYKVWERYKEDRKKKSQVNKENFPWEDYYEQYDQYIEDLRNHFPIKVLKIDSCEADDIIGVIAKEVEDPVEIVSTDKDFLQLSSDRVKIYNPMKKQHVSHPNPSAFLAEQIMCGQAKDSIFNIKTPLDHPEGKRKPGFGPKAFEKAYEHGIKDWLIENDLVERFRFNRTLMSFHEIPSELQNQIMQEYEEYNYPEPSMMWSFIEKQGWPEMIENFTQLENKFLELY